MKKTLINIIIILVVVIVGYFLYKTHSVVDSGNTIACEINLETATAKAKEIENKLSSYTSSTKNIVGQSAEGGEQIDYLLNSQRVLIKQTYFGETGKSVVNYYLVDNEVFYIQKENTEYLLPLSEDSSGKAKSIETKEFLLNQDQQLCSWYKNKQLQTIDIDAKDLINYLVGSI